MSHLIEKLMNCKSSSSLKRQVTFSPNSALTVYVCVSCSVVSDSLRLTVYKEDRSEKKKKTDQE